MANLLAVNEDNFQEEVLAAPIPVLVDFAADWCGPCKRLAPIVEEIAGEMSGKIKVVGVDIDAAQDIASDYNILSVPTLILFKDGEEVNRNIGLASKQNLIDFINNNI